MLRKKPLYSIIPVRGGSKGIPRKNLLKIRGETILERTIKLAQAESRIDHVFVSTDDDEMYEISRQYGVHMKSKRPDELAVDSALTIDVIKHLVESEEIERDAFILLLQTTSPLRNNTDLSEFLSKFEASIDTYDSAVSLARHDDPHPQKIQKIENGYVKSFLGGESMVPRQSLPEVYRLNGAMYLADVKGLLERRSFFSDRTMPFIMPRERSVNLDSMMDYYLLEMMIEKGLDGTGKS